MQESLQVRQSKVEQTGKWSGLASWKSVDH